jgi:thiamine biosynthesis lipoprotein
MYGVLKFFIIFIVTSIFLLTGCGKTTHEPVSQSQIHLGTYVTITSYDDTLDTAVINGAIQAAFRAIAEVEAKTNPYDPASDVSKINRQKDTDRIYFPGEQFLELTRAAIRIAEESGGKFDFTLWPVFRLWRFDTDSARVPPPDKIRQALRNVGYQKVKADSNRLLIAPGMEIDFGGISKGYAIEQARKVMVKRGLRNFIIDAGGNLGIEWHKEQEVMIHVRHPRKEGEFWGRFPVQRSCGIATSGDYHFYFIEDGARYHHILDPQTGYPARGVVSASVIAPTAILADGYSTAVFVLGHDAGSHFIESRPELEGLIIYPQGEELQTYLSPGLAEKFRFSNE